MNGYSPKLVTKIYRANIAWLKMSSILDCVLYYVLGVLSTYYFTSVILQF